MKGVKIALGRLFERESKFATLTVRWRNRGGFFRIERDLYVSDAPKFSTSMSTNNGDSGDIPKIASGEELTPMLGGQDKYGNISNEMRILQVKINPAKLV